ncbi:hypothetical protein GC175_14705 [bacterium]|nr:hypothetical protein [bacterium]
MHQVEWISTQLNRIQLGALIVAAVGVVLGIVGAILNVEHFFRGYLIGFLYWMGVTLGCLGLFMVMNLINGAFSFATQRLFAAGARTMFVMVALFVPLAFGLNFIYSWTNPEVLSSLPASKASFFTVELFLLRAALYFIIWIPLAYFVTQFSYRNDKTGDARLLDRAKQLSAAGLILLVVTITFAALDWSSSLTPKWFSSIYGLLYTAREGLSGAALVVLTLGLLWNHLPLSSRVRERSLNDIGSVLLASLMLWMYMEFFQFLIIWQGNMAEYAVWYVERLGGGWPVFVTIVLFLHFGIPFVLLLTPGFRSNVSRLIAAAALILVMRLFWLYWNVVPVFSPDVSLSWMDIVLPLAMGGIWVASFVWILKRNELLPINHSQWQEADAHGHGHTEAGVTA